MFDDQITGMGDLPCLSENTYTFYPRDVEGCQAPECIVTYPRAGILVAHTYVCCVQDRYLFRGCRMVDGIVSKTLSLFALVCTFLGPITHYPS